MQRKVLVAVVLLAAVAAVFLVASRPISLGQEQIPAPTPSGGRSAGPQTGNYLGVGSCASPACHGGADSAENIRQRGKWNSAYTVWIEKDKHAKAHSVLYSPESKKILRNLDHLGAAADPKPYRDERCLACHATVAKAAEDGGAFLADGVGCEACHGAARGWLAEHTVRTWSKTDPSTHRDTHGPAADGDGRMVNTRDMAVRAGVCADCHVGSPEAGGLPSRNMDHDMIAAGHPRLTFELGAFLANMPHHWDDRGEKSREDYAAHTWAVGQAATSEAALRLLSARAKAAEATPETARWPELSEYDCYTCHHHLSLDSYRQEIKGDSGRKPGRLAWGTWYLPTTRLLAQEYPAGPAGLTNVDRAADLMSDAAPDPSAVHAAADLAAQEMHGLLEGVKKGRYPRQVVDRMLLATKDRPAKNWDEACGQYLLFRSALSQDPRYQGPLAAVRDLLQFRDENQEHGPPIRYTSPFAFDPAKFNDKMSELRGLLPQK